MGVEDIAAGIKPTLKSRWGRNEISGTATTGRCLLIEINRGEQLWSQIFGISNFRDPLIFEVPNFWDPHIFGIPKFWDSKISEPPLFGIPKFSDSLIFENLIFSEFPSFEILNISGPSLFGIPNFRNPQILRSQIFGIPYFRCARSPNWVWLHVSVQFGMCKNGRCLIRVHRAGISARFCSNSQLARSSALGSTYRVRSIRERR